MHALIIENETIVALSIEEHLRDQGYTSFDLAATEAEAVAAAERRCPDLITSGVRLGDGCGISAVQTICDARPIPVIFITATEWEVRARAPGATMLRKPFLPMALDKALVEVDAPRRAELPAG